MRKIISRQLRRWGLRGFNGRINGRQFRVPYRYGVRMDLAEQWMPGLLTRLLPAHPGAFVDVGVNLGQTLLTVAAVDPARAYIGFEPNPACVEYAEALVAANGLRNCRIVPAALSDETGVVTLDIFHEDTDSAASIIQGYRPGQEIKARKAVVALSPKHLPPDLFADKVGVVKIDVEGAEKEVLTGLEPILRRDRPLVIVEVLPAYTIDNRPRIERQEAIEALMRALDYRILRLTEKSPLRVNRIPSIGIHDDLEQCEYLMVPAEVSEAVVRGVNAV